MVGSICIAEKEACENVGVMFQFLSWCFPKAQYEAYAYLGVFIGVKERIRGTQGAKMAEAQKKG